jgi:hypothetical protein
MSHSDHDQLNLTELNVAVNAATCTCSRHPPILAGCTLFSFKPRCACDAAVLSGLEHEAKLYAELARADIPFWTEQQLRQKGLFKTPDALLQVRAYSSTQRLRCASLCHADASTARS